MIENNHIRFPPENMQQLSPEIQQIIRNENREHEHEVDSTQVHKESENINYKKLISVLKTELHIPSPSPSPNLTFDYIETILKELSNNDPTILNGIELLMQQRLRGLYYAQFSKSIRYASYYTLAFVKQQPPEFQKAYIENYIHDVLTANNGTGFGAISCAGGALERIILSLSASCLLYVDKPEYETNKYDILVRAISGVDIVSIPLLTEFTKEWFQIHKQGTPEEFSVTESTENKIKSLKDFLLTKIHVDQRTLPETNRMIDEIISGVTFDPDDFVYGGKRRFKKRRFTKNKYNRNKNRRKSRKIKR